MVSVFTSVIFALYLFLFGICFSFLTFHSSLPCFVFLRSLILCFTLVRSLRLCFISLSLLLCFIPLWSFSVCFDAVRCFSLFSFFLSSSFSVLASPLHPWSTFISFHYLHSVITSLHLPCLVFASLHIIIISLLLLCFVSVRHFFSLSSFFLSLLHPRLIFVFFSFTSVRSLLPCLTPASPLLRFCLVFAPFLLLSLFSVLASLLHPR